MKKLIVVLVAVGAVIALRPVVKRRMIQKMQEHCKGLMAQFAGGSEATGSKATSPEAMRAHCELGRGTGVAVSDSHVTTSA